MQKMKKSNYVVWPAPSSRFLKMARGPKSLATPVESRYMVTIFGTANILF